MRTLADAFAAVLLAASPALAQPPPPRLHVVLSPNAKGGEDSYMGVRMTIQAPGLKADEALLRLPIRLVGIPTPPWPDDAVQAGLYGPCLTVEKHPVRPFQLGFARASLNDDRVVKDLEPGSEADKAGVRDGDVIVEAGDINAVRKDQAMPLKLTLRRGETTTTVSYLPRGAPTEGYRWARDPKTPDSACRL